MQILYAYFKTDEHTVEKSEKELFYSIEKAYDLYHYIFLLLTDVTRYFESKMDIARHKNLPTREDLNPNTRFIDNRVINQILSNKSLNTFLNNKKLSWVNYPELARSLYADIKDSQEYNLYINKPDNNYEDDKRIILDICQNYIPENKLLFQILEEQSIYWNDDVEFIISMIIKTIKGFKENQSDEIKLLDLYKNDEDREFVRDLFRKTIKNDDENSELIKTYTKNWDVDRIAFMDVLLMKMAITEVMEMPAVPTKVTMNEYIEIVKYYSTEKSSVFINGILDKIINTLKKDKKIVKKGRGLIGEV